MPTPKGKVKLIVDIPNELKQEFKVYCAMNRVNMTDMVEQLLTQFLNKQNKKGAI